MSHHPIFPGNSNVYWLTVRERHATKRLCEFRLVMFFGVSLNGGINKFMACFCSNCAFAWIFFFYTRLFLSTSTSAEFSAFIPRMLVLFPIGFAHGRRKKRFSEK